MTACFLDLLRQAAELVEKAYPGSKLYEADGNSSAGNASQASQSRYLAVRISRVIAAGPPDVSISGRTKTASSVPVLQNQTVLGDHVISLPVAMGLDRAIELKDGAGEAARFNLVLLRWPLSSGNTEPLYIFRNAATGKFVFVGTQTGRLPLNPLTRGSG